MQEELMNLMQKHGTLTSTQVSKELGISKGKAITELKSMVTGGSFIVMPSNERSHHAKIFAMKKDAAEIKSKFKKDNGKKNKKIQDAKTKDILNAPLTVGGSVPADWYSKFDAICLQNNQTMSDRIAYLVKQDIEKSMKIRL